MIYVIIDQLVACYWRTLLVVATGIYLKIGLLSLNEQHMLVCVGRVSKNDLRSFRGIVFSP